MELKEIKKELSSVQKELQKKCDVFDKSVKSLRLRRNQLQNLEMNYSNRELIGRCFKYKNSYGSESDDWWLFIKVVGTTETGGMITLEIQETSTGKIEITREDHYSGSALIEPKNEITVQDFDIQLKRLLKKLGISSVTDMLK